MKLKLLSEEQYKKITEVLSDLASKTGAFLVLFADMDGHLISYQGDAESLDISALSALAAGDFTATVEMARLIGEKSSFKLLFHEGVEKNLYMCNVDEEFLLLVVFDSSVTLGMVRLYTKKAVNRIDQLLQFPKEEVSQIINSEFKSLLGEELDRILE